MNVGKVIKGTELLSNGRVLNSTHARSFFPSIPSRNNLSLASVDDKPNDLSCVLRSVHSAVQLFLNSACVPYFISVFPFCLLALNSQK